MATLKTLHAASVSLSQCDCILRVLHRDQSSFSVVTEEKPDIVFLTAQARVGLYQTPQKLANLTCFQLKIAIIQWVSEQGELTTLHTRFVQSWKRAQELDYDILRYFNDHPTLSESDRHSLVRKILAESISAWRINPWSL